MQKKKLLFCLSKVALYNALLYSFFLKTPIAIAEPYETLTVRVRAQDALQKCYLSSQVSSAHGISKEYADVLLHTFETDLENSAKFTLIKEDPELESLVFNQTQNSRLLSAMLWTKNSIPYLILPEISKDLLQIQVFSFHPYFSSKVFEISLSKDFLVDQAAIHNAHDAIIQFLFKEPGIASSHILYVKTMPKYSTLQNSISEIWEMDYDGKNPRKIIANNSLNLNPVYFPNSTDNQDKKFLFVSYIQGQPKIFTSSIQGQELQSLTSLRGNQILPNISRQADKVAFICDATGRPDLFLQHLHATGQSIGKPIQIFSKPHSVNASPSFSPDGNKLAFVSDMDWTPRIYLLNLRKENSIDNLTCITKKNRENTAPSWSPDGKKIAYSAKTNGIRQIWIYDLNTQEETQITTGPHHKENPFFAPNSLHIVYNTTGRESHVYMVDINRKKTMQITHGPEISHYPAWEPK